MPKFAGLSVCSTWAAAGGTPIREVARLALLECKAQRTVENPDQNRLDVGVRRTWDGLSELTPRRVLRVSYTNGAFDEWRINTQQRATLGGTGIKRFSCLPPIYMLAECGEYYTTGAGGVRDYSYSLIDVTASQALTTLVLGTPGLPGFVGLGTVDAAVDAVLIDVASTDEGKTPLAIAFQIRDAVRAKGVSCELAYRRVGTTSYVIDLVTQVGAGAAVPEFAAGKNLLDYLLTYNCTRQTTRVRPIGPVDATGLRARLSRARYKVTAVNGGTKRVTVADELGGAGPVQFDEQYVGWFVFREKTGRTFQILHTYKATQEIELADVSTMAAHSVTAPEWITFRETEALTGTRRWGSDAPTGAGTPYKARWAEVTAVGAGTLTLTDNWGVGDPVDVDGRWIDWQLRRASLVLATSFTMNVTAGRLDCASVAGVQAGDIVVIGANAAAPYGSTSLGSAPGTTQAVVTSVDAVNKYLHCSIRYAGAWITGPFTYYARIFRTVATRHMVTGSTASTNVVGVDAVGTAAATDLVEIVQECQGVLPTHVESPADVSAYDVKLSTLEVSDTGECNLVPNPVMRAWTGGASVAPDGWTWTESGGGAAATITRISDPAFTLQGGYSALCNFSVVSGKNGELRCPPSFVNPTVEAGIATARVRLWFTLFNANAECYVELVKISAAGTVSSLSPVAKVTLLAASTALGTWVDITVSGTISALIDERLEVKITANASYGVRAYVDGGQITQTPSAPRAYPELLIEYAEGTKLLQQANVELLAWAGPPKEFSAKIADFARVDPATHGADEVTLGGNIRLFHTEETVDETVRCLSMGENYLNEADTDLTIAVLPPRLTSLVTFGSAA